MKVKAAAEVRDARAAMTALTWLLTCLLQLLPAVSELPRPVNLSLSSTHFRTMLKWEPGAGTPTGAYYNVTFNTDRGANWKPVKGCERVQNPLVCNLTDAFSDPDNSYLVNVTSVLGYNKSQPASYSYFKLIRDSQLYLPLVAVTLCDMKLCVDLQFPKFYMLYMSQHHRDIYNSSLAYKVKINDAELPQEFKYLQKHIVTPSASGREYCVAVCFWNRLESRESNYSQPVCVSTPGVISSDVWISAGLCALVGIGVVTVALRLSPGFLYTSSPLPLVLTSVPHIEDVPIMTSSSISLTVVLTKLPSSGEGGHKLIPSDESDGESETESAGGENTFSEAADLLPCFSLTSASFPPANQTSCSRSAVTSRLNTNTDRGPVGTTEPDEAEQDAVGDGDRQDVNLLTVTLGRHNVEDEEEQESPVDAVVERMTPSNSDALSIPSVQPSHPDTREDATEIMSHSSDEEDEKEEEGGSGYMGRLCTAVSQRF